MEDGAWVDIDVCSLKKGPWDLLEGWGGVMGARSDTGVCEASGDILRVTPWKLGSTLPDPGATESGLDSGSQGASVEGV